MLEEQAWFSVDIVIYEIIFLTISRRREVYSVDNRFEEVCLLTLCSVVCLVRVVLWLSI